VASEKTAGLVLLEILLVILFPTLNTNIQTISNAENATTLDKTAGVLLPYGILFIIIILAAVIVYDVVGERR
jgi:hypothetical protein